MPTGGVLGTGATDFFCTAVEKGSGALTTLLRNPALMLGALVALLGLLVVAVVRTTWRPSAPLRVGRRRGCGQILTAAAWMYVQRAPLFLGIGLLLIPIGFVIAVVQALVIGGFGLLGLESEGGGGGRSSCSWP